ncbi:MAG: hypothetical protein ACLQGP_40170 [Isosphaeraceae bacterium]
MGKVLMRKGRGKEILLMDPSLFRLHRYLLILSHARSYTTLLCHILGSHRQIAGYGETLLPYETAVDLYRLNAKACEAGNYRTDCEYVLDKMLYDQLALSDKVLGLPRVIPIFMIREPEPTIASLTRMRVREHELGIHKWDEGTDRRATASFSATYYTRRLQTLQSYCQRLEALGGRGILLASDCLLDDTDGTFRFLERELGLDGPLSEEYTIFERTGEPGSGDTSTTIRTGRIVRDVPEQEQIPLRADLFECAQDAYTACVDYLRNSSVLVQHGW